VNYKEKRELGIVKDSTVGVGKISNCALVYITVDFNAKLSFNSCDCCCCLFNMSLVAATQCIYAVSISLCVAEVKWFGLEKCKTLCRYKMYDGERRLCI